MLWLCVQDLPSASFPNKLLSILIHTSFVWLRQHVVVVVVVPRGVPCVLLARPRNRSDWLPWQPRIERDKYNRHIYTHTLVRYMVFRVCDGEFLMQASCGGVFDFAGAAGGAGCAECNALNNASGVARATTAYTYYIASCRRAESI